MKPTRFVFVSPEMANVFWSEWRAIDRRFPAMEPAPDGMPLDEHWQNLAALRDSARAELRQAITEATKQGHGGDYPIAV